MQNSRGLVDAIRRQIIRIVEGMESLGAGYGFGSGPSLSTNIRLADFKYAVEVYREHMTV
jgi:hypothetical protein